MKYRRIHELYFRHIDDQIVSLTYQAVQDLTYLVTVGDIQLAAWFDDDYVLAAKPGDAH